LKQHQGDFTTESVIGNEKLFKFYVVVSLIVS